MEPTPPTQLQLHIDPSLEKYSITLTQYLATHPQCTNLVVSAFIFDTGHSKGFENAQRPRLLILQRAAHEFSFANKWEIPGGSSSLEDPTIIHSLAREVFEETGLRLTRVVRQVGDVIEFQTGKAQRRENWAKINFEIDVEEIIGLKAQADANAKTATKNEVQKLPSESKSEGKDIAVTIDPREHQSFAWITAEEIREGIYSIATVQQERLMLEALLAQETRG